MLLDRYLAVSEESNSVSSTSVDSKHSGSLKKTHTHKQSSKNNGGMMPLFMMTLRDLILKQFQRLTSSPVDSPAKTSVPQEKELASRGVAVHSGNITLRRLGFYDHRSHSLKTYQSSLVEDSMLSLVTLPRSGMMQNGIVYQLPPLVRIIKGIDYLLFPTPKRKGANGNHARRLSEIVKFPTPQGRDWKGKSQRGNYDRAKDCLPNAVGGQLNPTWVEWLMGFPIGWTELDASEIALYRKLRKSLQKQLKKS